MSSNSSSHRHAWDLIPWIVNGSAHAQERTAVETHLSQCDECRAELQFQRELCAAVRTEPAGELAAGNAEHELSLQRLRARLECDENAPVATGGLLAYRTLSAAQIAPTGATIRIVFEPRVTLGQLQALLERRGLTVVGGPSPAGVWTLAPSSTFGHAAMEAALSSLRADPVVRFSEPLDSAP
jgi:anti-sigma factor RsiW